MSQISYLYYKTGQGVNFGSCEDKFTARGNFLTADYQFQTIKYKLEKQGFKCEIEASTPELRAEQLKRIRNDKGTK